jgi:hypothetical protein
MRYVWRRIGRCVAGGIGGEMWYVARSLDGLTSDGRPREVLATEQKGMRKLDGRTRLPAAGIPYRRDRATTRERCV